MLQPHEFTTFVDLLRARAEERPDSPAFCFLIDGEVEGSRLTYAELDLAARRIAVKLREVAGQGDRAMLLFDPGLDFVSAFYGCLYAGVVAVPAASPRRNRASQRNQTLASIAENCRPSVLLTGGSNADLISRPGQEIPGLQSLPKIITDQLDELPAARWRHPNIDPEAVALLQYTSGSTRTPRGVMVTHRNIMHNERTMRIAFAHHLDQPDYFVGVNWLPVHHDMGLYSSILQTVYIGATVYMMSPVAFLKQPLRWLQAMTKYRATTSGGPPFCYELCTRTISPEARKSLDLQTWSIAAVGAEPIIPDTLDSFVDTFADCGFRRTAFYPAYGLAESTVIVTGGDPAAAPVVRTFAASELKPGSELEAHSTGEAKPTRLVGCGWPRLGQEVKIVDPNTCLPVPPGAVGEIWVAGPSVASGYWDLPEETQRIFGARLADSNEGPFLRTEDLGMIVDGHLFVTGRIKDLIIVHGRNHYPQDIEDTVQSVHPALLRSCGAAFAVTMNGEQKLVVVQEVDRQHRQLDVGILVTEARRALAEEHGLQLHDFVFVRQATIPKTSSGKIQRSACKQHYDEGTLMRLNRE